MKVKILISGLFLLVFSINTQAQVALKGTKTVLHQEVTTVEKEATPASKKSSQQTKNNIRRRNMAKYRTMSRKTPQMSTSAIEKKKRPEKKRN